MSYEKVSEEDTLEDAADEIAYGSLVLRQICHSIDAGEEAGMDCSDHVMLIKAMHKQLDEWLFERSTTHRKERHANTTIS